MPEISAASGCRAHAMYLATAGDPAHWSRMFGKPDDGDGILSAVHGARLRAPSHLYTQTCPPATRPPGQLLYEPRAVEDRAWFPVPAGAVPVKLRARHQFSLSARGMRAAARLSVSLVDVRVRPDLAAQISQMLTESTEYFKESKGGHVPDHIVDTVIHRAYTSMESVMETFADTGYRFAMTNPQGEVLATALLSRSPDVYLVKDSSNLNAPRSAHPDMAPPGHHQLINFVTRLDLRGGGLARVLFEEISRQAQFFSGTGVWTYAEPSMHAFWTHFGFRHRTEYDQLFEPGVQLPDWAASPWAFNRRYLCVHPRSPEQRTQLLTHKYRYGLFTRPFSAPLSAGNPGPSAAL